MSKGKVKWFNEKKGYGFITPDGGGKDIFIHHSGIAGSGYKTLEDGISVNFETTQGPKGEMAVNVRKA